MYLNDGILKLTRRQRVYVAQLLWRYDWPAVLASARWALATEPCTDRDNPGDIYGVVYMGDITTMSPSGKVYTAFATSNVAGDCPVCKGLGERPNPRHDVTVAATVEAMGQVLFSHMKASGYVYFSDWPESMRDMRQRLNVLAEMVAPMYPCEVYMGYGSRSAARDEDWWVAFEYTCKLVGLDRYTDMWDEGIRVCVAGRSTDMELM